jgi:hypothetical protein
VPHTQREARLQDVGVCTRHACGALTQRIVPSKVFRLMRFGKRFAENKEKVYDRVQALFVCVPLVEYV